MKKAIALLMILIALLSMSGCEKNSPYEYALIQLPSGKQIVVEIEDYYILESNVQITATDGTVYLVSTTDCILVKESNK